MATPSHLSELPKPGQVVHVDFRQQELRFLSSETQRPLRLVQWNIERGYQLQLVIQHLQALDADIISLQEVQLLHCLHSATSWPCRHVQAASARVEHGMYLQPSGLGRNHHAYSRDRGLYTRWQWTIGQE